MKHLKRTKAMQAALSLHRAARELRAWQQNSHDSLGMLSVTYWFPDGPQNFGRPEELESLANRIVREALQK